ncbi:MAG: hypothetical protein Q9224_001821 [Gallowayella concinna]
MGRDPGPGVYKEEPAPVVDPQAAIPTYLPLTPSSVLFSPCRYPSPVDLLFQATFAASRPATIL